MRRFREWLRALMSLHGSPAGIAGGFVVGLGLSLVPIPFVGMLVALALAPLLRCNLPATYLGTAVVNPLTGAFIYFGELWIGLRLLGQTAPQWSRLRALDGRGWLDLFLELAPAFFVGAAVVAATSAVVMFPLLYRLTSRWQARSHPPPTDGSQP